MSCDFFQRHFVAGGQTAGFEAHRRLCAECKARASEFVRLAASVSRLHPPAVPSELAKRWMSIPGMTADCDHVAEFLAGSAEGNLPAADAARLQFHLGRCQACRETAEVLGVTSALRLPEPPPGLLSRRPPASVVPIEQARGPRKSRWLDPRLYAAAACLVAGLLTFVVNAAGPLSAADPSAGFAGRVARSVRVRAAEWSDDVALLEEKLSRRVIAARASIAGYGKAAGNIALSAAGRAAEEFLLKTGSKVEKGKKS